jgi:hypothetical protein
MGSIPAWRHVLCRAFHLSQAECSEMARTSIVGNCTWRLCAVIAFLLCQGMWFPTAAHGQCDQWHELDSGMNAWVGALRICNGELIAGGDFTSAGGVAANRIARRDGAAWQPLGSGMNDRVLALTVYNGELIAGGSFTSAGGVAASRIARWDGAAWQTLGSGMNHWVGDLTVYNGELIAGGNFTSAGGVAANNIARWDGAGWQALGSGMTTAGVGSSWVGALSVYNGELIAGGLFTSAGGQTARRIARWAACPPAPCYANCDNSTVEPTLNVEDFTCFISEFAAASVLPHEEQVGHYANCDGSTTPPVLNVEDFTCFITAFAAGCP